MNRLRMWWLENSKQLERFMLVANLVGLPLFALAAWHFGWFGTGSSGQEQCGAGPIKWDC